MDRVGLIGCGNLATAFLKGLSNDHVSGSLVYVYDIDKDKVQSIVTEFGVNEAKSLSDLFEKTKMVIVMVKPQNFTELSKDIQPLIGEHTIVSVMAGMQMHKLYELLGRDTKIIRTMPNTPASVNEGITGVVVGDRVTPDDQNFFESVFEHFGMVAYIKETQFDAFTAICGSSPAFIYMFIQGMIEGGVHEGLDPTVVPKMVAQAVLGAAKMVRESDIDPVTLRENVTSKGGVTWKGVESLQNANFEEIVKNAIVQTTRRSIELNKEMENDNKV